MLAPAGILSAQVRGIGVHPGTITIPHERTQPFAIPVTVTNFSDTPEWIEVTLSRNLVGSIHSDPGTFALSPKEARVVHVVITKPDTVTEKGSINISGVHTSPQGVRTGTGIVLAVVPEKDTQDETNILLGASLGHMPTPLPTTLILGALFLVLLSLLWRISGRYARYRKVHSTT